VIIRLVRTLDVIKEPAARSLIIWIFGEYSSTGNLIPRIAPAVLKYLAWSFAAEVLETKLQILNTCAKVYSNLNVPTLQWRSVIGLPFQVIIHAAEEHLQEFKRIVAYVIQLAACDLNYDVRDRARFLSGLLPFCANENDSSRRSQNADVCKELADHIFDGKIHSASNSDSNYRIYLPGSLSQVVLHAAPGYAPLPKPQSMVLIHKTMESTRGVANSSDSNNSDAESGSSANESGSLYDSESEGGDLSDRDGTGSKQYSNDDGHNLHLQEGNQEAPLVNMYDGSVGQGHAGQVDENLASLISTDLTELMSKSALESWLDEAPTTPLVQNSIQASCARVSFTTRSFERKPKLHVLLDPSNSNGLSVLYAFSSEVSPNSRLLVCIDLFVENVTPDQLANISIKSEEASTSEHGMETSEGSARYASSVKKTNWTITYIARCL
jgi:AP-3 complex subunit beta